VLQLARLTRNEQRPSLQPGTLGELIAGVQAKLSSQTEQAGFRLNLACDEQAKIGRASCRERVS
jgi:hypothetical protein